MAGYLGDTKKNLVHHLATITSECGVYFVKKHNRKYFQPDTLEQALREGFLSCKLCINE